VLTRELDDAEVVLVPTGSLREDEGSAMEAEDGTLVAGGFDATIRLKDLVVVGGWLLSSEKSSRGFNAGLF